MLEAAAQWLATTLATTEGVDATYTRTGETPIPLTVVPGRMRPERYALADGRANLEVEPADFLVLAAAIDFGAGPVEPQTGDRVTLADGRTYELLPRDAEPSQRATSQYPVVNADGSIATRAPMYRLRTIRVLKVGP
jgi:hypothetical protein